jgi:hypothetical protein
MVPSPIHVLVGRCQARRKQFELAVLLLLQPLRPPLSSRRPADAHIARLAPAGPALPRLCRTRAAVPPPRARPRAGRRARLQLCCACSGDCHYGHCDCWDGGSHLCDICVWHGNLCRCDREPERTPAVQLWDHAHSRCEPVSVACVRICVSLSLDLRSGGWFVLEVRRAGVRPAPR